MDSSLTGSTLQSKSSILGILYHDLETNHARLEHPYEQELAVATEDAIALWKLSKDWSIPSLNLAAQEQIMASFEAAAEDEVKQVIKLAFPPFDTNPGTPFQKSIAESLTNMLSNRREEIMSWLGWFPKALSEEMLHAVILSYAKLQEKTKLLENAATGGD